MCTVFITSTTFATGPCRLKVAHLPSFNKERPTPPLSILIAPTGRPSIVKFYFNTLGAQSWRAYILGGGIHVYTAITVVVKAVRLFFCCIGARNIGYVKYSKGVLGNVGSKTSPGLLLSLLLALVVTIVLLAPPPPVNMLLG